MKFITCIIVPVLLIIFNVNCQTRSNQMNIPLRSGDLLFFNATSTELSKAIDQATKTAKETHFDHVGIVEVNNDTVWVLHAAPKKGVCREQIGQVLTEYKELHAGLTVYRLKSDYTKSVKTALLKARSFLNQQYKYSYRLSDPGFYCSEFIYRIFASDSIFKLNPMTFKDPHTGKFLPGWITHYRKLGIPIPEGEPGCNPNGLALSEKLENLGILTIKK